MSKKMVCWQCGSTLENVIFPVSRREECLFCHADQHVCKMCKEFDGSAHCQEPRAEEPKDREKANFCDYFLPSFQNFVKAKNTSAENAKAKLAELFGEDTIDIVNTSNTQTDEQLSPQQIAEQKLRDLLRN